MNEYMIKPLGPGTWDDFARLIERQGNASFGAPGCWCLWFHPDDAARDPDGENGRARKERLVKQGRAHAALVFDGDARSGGASTAARTSCRASITARITRRVWSSSRIIG